MASRIHGKSVFRVLSALLLLALLITATACTQKAQPGGGDGEGEDKATDSKYTPPDKPAPPQYKSFVVYINDDDSFTQGSVTYSIALNFTATNPSGEAAGEYTGKATASTTSEGTVNGLPLNASAMAQSGTLTFTLEDASASSDDLASLTLDGTAYKGTGTITMKASGSGTVGPAGGSFGNTSSQAIDISTEGSKATLTVVIQGHKYTFHGLIRGEE